jgi:pilus assembly protein Flp/PilA
MRKFFSKTVKPFSREEKGATMFEYAILVGVIAVVAIVGAAAFGTSLNGAFNALSTNVTTNVTNPATNNP